MPIADFEIGRIYQRRSIHAKYGGQMQSGISTPGLHPLIFAFTGATGRQHGYADEWTEDGALRYFGEGQDGDMTLTRGNKAIADHAVDGKELLLFEALGAGRVRFRGAFNCADFSYEQGVDRAGSPRRVIIFRLVPVEAEEQRGDFETELTADHSELRRRAFAAAGPAREVTTGGATSFYVRSATVRAYVLDRASGRCEGCNTLAPFVTPAGTPYLEPHHIRRLTDGGLDDPRHMAALCPNCHRRVHYGQDGDMLNRQIQGRIAAKERPNGQPKAQSGGWDGDLRTRQLTGR